MHASETRDFGSMEVKVGSIAVGQFKLGKKLALGSNLK